MAIAGTDRPGIGTRMLGVLGIAGGLVLLVAFLPSLPWDAQITTGRLVLFNVGAIAVAVTVHQRQAVLRPRLSLAASAAVVIANAWYLVMVVLSVGRPVYPEPDPQFRQVFFYAALALWLADAAFGFAALRIGAVTRLGSFALGAGSLLAGSGIGGLWFTTGPLAALFGPLSLLGIGLVGIGWILLGLDVAMGRGAGRSAPSVTSPTPS